jgi:pimeloyl-ACP methyl ester carboxylesterase
MQVAARGYTFDVDVQGPDGPPVVLLHGFPQDLTMWDEVRPPLHSAGFRTYAINQRGYSVGARPDDVAAYAMAECVADLVALLDVLGLPSVHLVGHDWGAVVAWHAAAGHGDRVRTLTAIAVPHPHAVGEAMAAGDEQKQRMAYMKLFRMPGRAEEVLLEDGARRLTAMFAGCPKDRVPHYVERMREPGALTGALNWYRAMSRFDAAQLGRVEVPTAYLYGDADLAVGEQAAQACAHYVTGPYRFVRFSGISHWVPDQVPDRVASEIISLANA